MFISKGVCLFLPDPVPTEIIKNCQRQNSWMCFSFLPEDTWVAWMLLLTGAWAQACCFKRPHLQVQVSKYAVPRLGPKIQAVVTNALAKQRYKIAICIFSYCMDRKHAVSSRSPSLTAYSHSRASHCHFCLSASSFTPSIVSFPNRWGLKPLLSALFLNNITLMQMRRQKDGRETVSLRIHMQISSMMHWRTG